MNHAQIIWPVRQQQQQQQQLEEQRQPTARTRSNWRCLINNHQQQQQQATTTTITDRSPQTADHSDEPCSGPGQRNIAPASASQPHEHLEMQHLLATTL
ncbi:hypothetical protein AWZ03_000851 [Drosophila navojoa]|uniref:Uncharacterized protein n=1 Tax=Drosophila navojoa TaxID=7232 RepID=A0A484BV00_DRONA|nr:hypothetical protein AWZ03_000851 [Drosophila navojoa]